MNFFNSVINFFKDGGFFLYPLALIFVVGVSIAIERYVYLTRETIRNRGLWDELVPALSTGNFKQVVALTQNSKASIATILNYGVARVASARDRAAEIWYFERSLAAPLARSLNRRYSLRALSRPSNGHRAAAPLPGDSPIVCLADLGAVLVDEFPHQRRARQPVLAVDPHDIGPT